MVKSSRVRYATTVAAGWAVLLSGCAAGATSQSDKLAVSARPSAVVTVNDICPISRLSVQRDAPVALYQGLAVGFCGPRCVSAWMMRTDTEKRELIAETASDPRLRMWGPPPRNPFR